MFITLRCHKCDYVDCPIARAYVTSESQEGCTREVPQETYEKWQHLMVETLPFLSLRKITSRIYSEIDKLETEVYSSKLGRKLDYSGKALPAQAESTQPSKNQRQDTDHPQCTPCNENKSHSVPDILSL